GEPGTEHELFLPPVKVRFPSGKSLAGYWPPLREASRLAPGDLAHPVPRGAAVVPDHGSSNRALGLGLAAGAGAALLAAGILAALAILLAAAIGLAGRSKAATRAPVAATGGSTTEVVLDVSGSVGDTTYAFTESTLTALARSGNVGLVVFSDTAEEALPPGTP